jgi:hypothetical protein
MCKELRDILRMTFLLLLEGLKIVLAVSSVSHFNHDILKGIYLMLGAIFLNAYCAREDRWWERMRREAGFK